MRRQCRYDDPLWTLAFAAAYLGICVRSLRALIGDSVIAACYPFARNVREMRVPREEILRYADLLRSGQQVAAPRPAPANGSSPAYDPRIRHGHPRPIERDIAAMYKTSAFPITPSRR